MKNIFYNMAGPLYLTYTQLKTFSSTYNKYVPGVCRRILKSERQSPKRRDFGERRNGKPLVCSQNVPFRLFSQISPFIGVSS